MNMDVDKVYKLLRVAEMAPKFPPMTGKITQWVNYAILELNREIDAELDAMKQDIQQKHDEAQRVKAAEIEAKAEPVEEHKEVVGENNLTSADQVRRL